MFHKKVSRLLAVTLVIILLDILGCLLFYQWIIRSKPDNKIPRTQAGLIFFAGANSDYSGMAADSLRSVNYTLDLYEQDMFEHIVCLGGAYHAKNFYGSGVMKDYLVQQGVKPKRIFTEYRSCDSYSNWESACAIIKQNQWTSITLISSPMHIQRLPGIIAHHPCIKKVYYATYDYGKQKPLISLREIYFRVHHEWVAYAADLILPQSIYRYYVRQTRQK